MRNILWKASMCMLMLASCAPVLVNRKELLTEAARLESVRRFDESAGLIENEMRRSGADADLEAALAHNYYESKQFNLAASLYQHLIHTYPVKVEWIVLGWDSRLRTDPDNPEIKNSIISEIESAMQRDETRIEAAYQAAAWILNDHNLAERIEPILVGRYPGNETSEMIARNALDEISTESDRTACLEKIRLFIKKYSVSRYLPEIVQYELFALADSGRKEEFILRARYWHDRYPENAKVLLDLSNLLSRFETDPDWCLNLAKTAYELNENESSKRSNTDREKSANKPDFSIFWGDYAVGYIRALFFAGKKDEAGPLVQRLLNELPDNNKGFQAAAHFFKGELLLSAGRREEALRQFIESTRLGAPRNRWIKESLEHISRFYPYTPEFEKMNDLRRMMNYRGPVFEDITETAGLSEYRNSRVAWGDINGDGFKDILLDGHLLLKNQDGARFERLTAGLQENGCGGVFADVDNDGDTDLFVFSHGETMETGDAVYLNRGDGIFDRVEDSGVADIYPTEAAAWGDFDGDGLVDLYVANYEKKVTEDQAERGIGTPDFFYRNIGSGRFEDFTVKSGIIPPFGKDLCGRGVCWCDFDSDGDQDIFVSNYRLQENLLWRNDSGFFTNVAMEKGVAGTNNDGYFGHTIASAWGDYNRDGWMDLFCANLAHPRYIEFSDISQLLVNSGPPDFVFTDQINGSEITYDETHSVPAWIDIDRDGDLDLYITSVYPQERSYFYLQEADGSFTDIAFLSGTRVDNGWAVEFCDFDNDGDPDLLVGSGSGVRLFKNREDTTGYWAVHTPARCLPFDFRLDMATQP